MLNIEYFDDIKDESVASVAREMLIAAKTAPKGRGIDNLVYACCVDKESLNSIADKMLEIYQREDVQIFERDAENLRNAAALVLLGTKIKSTGLKYCGLCGFSNCEEKNKQADTPCIFNVNDLGIAVGSAVSIAMDNRIDNRVMYTIGMAAKELGIMGEDVQIVFGIPLSASSKNIFFDRK